MTWYKNKYRVESIRLKNWDYASPGGYFVTICTKNRVPYFGKIVHGTMELSEIGRIAETYWREIPAHFPHVALDEFVIMPDHIHGIIVIMDMMDMMVETMVETPNLGVSTSPTSPTIPPNHWKPGSLGVIINQYKRICTIQIRKRGYNFAWQSRYYDSIIPDAGALERIRRYIINNPAKWEQKHHARSTKKQ